MTDDDIDRIQLSFALVLPEADRAAQVFYDRLFAIAPQTRSMFPPDITAQGRKLIQTLAVVVDSLPRLPTILPVVRELALRHVRYGVVDAHYDLVGTALLDMLRTLLGSQFDARTEAAWAAAYTVLSDTMIQATKRAA